MSAESELYAALSGHAALTALVSTRIYPDAIPEDQPLPAVVYLVVLTGLCRCRRCATKSV